MNTTQIPDDRTPEEIAEDEQRAASVETVADLQFGNGSQPQPQTEPRPLWSQAQRQQQRRAALEIAEEIARENNGANQIYRRRTKDNILPLSWPTSENRVN